MKYFLETIYRRTPSTDSSLEESMKYLRKYWRLNLSWNDKVSKEEKNIELFYFNSEKSYVYPRKKITEELQSNFFKLIKLELQDLWFENNTVKEIEWKNKKIVDVSKISSINQFNIEIEEKQFEKYGKTKKLSNVLEEHWYEKQVDLLEDPSNIAYYNEKYKEMKPRIHQEESINRAIENLITKQNLHWKWKWMLILPTWYWKTFISAAVANWLKKTLQKKDWPFRVLFLVHKNDIVYQTAKLFGNWTKWPFSWYFWYDKIWMMIWIDKKFAKCINNVFNPKQANDVIIANIKTMKNIKNKFSKDYFDLIIADECHRSLSNEYRENIEYFDYKYLLWITATPERTDEASWYKTEDLFKFFDNNVIYEKSLSDAIWEKILATPYYFIRWKDVSEQMEKDIRRQLLYKTYQGWYQKWIKSYLKNLWVFNDDLEYLHKEKKRTIVFCENIDIAKETYDKIRNKYSGNTIMMFWRPEYYNAKWKKLEKVWTEITAPIMEERIRQFKDFDVEKKGWVFLVVVDLFIEGTDIPEVNAMMMLRPTSSNRVYFQILWRWLRKTETKDQCLVFDYNFETIKVSLLQEKIDLLKSLKLSLEKEKYKELYNITINYIDKIQSFISQFENLSNEEKNKFKTAYRQEMLKTDIFPEISKKILEVRKKSSNKNDFLKKLLKIEYQNSMLWKKPLFIETWSNFEKLEDLYNANCITDIIKELEDCYIHLSNQLTFKSETKSKEAVHTLTDSQKEQLEKFLDKNPQIWNSYEIKPATNSFHLEKFWKHTMIIEYKPNPRKGDVRKLPIY